METVHVVIAMGEDDEPYAYPASEGDAEDVEGTYETDVPAALWAEVDAAWLTIRKAFDQVRQIAGIDPDDWKLREPCVEWSGHEYPAQEWWVLAIPQSGDEKVWPRIDVKTGHFDTEAEARAFLDELPDSFVVVDHRPWTIDKSTLTIERHGYTSRAHECDQCGWARDEHRPQEPRKARQP